MRLESSFGGAAAGLERVRGILAVPRPASVRRMLELNAEPVVLAEPLITSDGVALGGDHTITLRPDGSVRYAGRLRATGLPSYDVAVSTRVIGADGVVATIVAHGSVHGFNEGGERELSWVEDMVSPPVASHWLAFRRARLEHDLQYDADLFGAAGSVATFLGKAVAAAYTGGAVGALIVLGSEATAALGAHELALPGLVGVAVAGGTLLVLGSGAALPAIVAGATAGAVTAALVRQRRLTDAEYAFVDEVFHGTLPRERIVLTNLLGLGGRPFTAPVPGGAILVNLGDGFGEPTTYAGLGEGNPHVQGAGQLLIHELCHAWQIEHSPLLPSFMCKAVRTQLGTLGGDMSAYAYGPAGLAWSEYESEQQASIVDQWFAGNGRQSAYPRRCSSLDANGQPVNPYWRYIRDNIRVGVT